MSTPLQISEDASLALHSLVLLTARPDTRLSNAQIAEELSVSEAHLSKVLQRLAKAGLLDSARGPRGGFSLARPPETISLLEAYETIEGPLEVRDCLFEEPVCAGKGCILNGFLKEVQAGFRDRLAGATLADMTHVFAQTP